MIQLLSTMTPIFGLVALGFGAVRLGVIEEAGVRGLVLFVFNFAIPALLLVSLADLDLPSDPELGFLAAFYGGSFIAYGLGMALGRFGFRRPLADQAIFGMGAGYANLVMMGIPVVLMALGPEASLPMLLIIAFQAATFMPLSVVLIQRGRGGSAPVGRQVAGAVLELLRNPIIVGIGLGLVVNRLGGGLPGSLRDVLDLLGSAAIPCALFAMGASLAGYPLRGDLSPALALSALKLVVHPLLVWTLAVPVMGLAGPSVSVAVLLAGMPSAVNTYLFGARYEVSDGVAARTVLLTTIGSAATISVVLALLGG